MNYKESLGNYPTAQSPRSPNAPPNIFNLPFAAAETWINTLEYAVNTAALLDEANKTQDEIIRFKNMQFSQDEKERKLWNGEHVERKNNKIVLTQGFFPPIEALLEASEDKIYGPIEPYFKSFIEETPFDPKAYRPARKKYLEEVQKAFGFKSNDMLNPFKEWLERMGNTVEFGLIGNNTLQTRDFFELVGTTERLAEDGQVTMIGISAGGRLNELVALYLKLKHGRDVVKMLVKAGSPEITKEVLNEFDNLSKQDGPGAVIHRAAEICMNEDPFRGSDMNLSTLQEFMERYAAEREDPEKKKYIPAAREVVYYTETDLIVPKPHRSAIEVGGTHAGLLYSPTLLKHLSEHVLSKPTMPPKEYIPKAA